VIEVVEGRSAEVVTPEKPDGVRLDVPARPTLWGRIEFGLYVAPPDGRRRRVAVVGRAGTTIVDDIAELDEFSAPPWTSDQVSGQIVFESLQQSAGRRAILRDRDAFPVFLDAIRAIEPAVTRAIERVAKQVDAQTADRLADAVRKIFGRVLRELADIDNPMRTSLGDQPGEGGLMQGLSSSAHDTVASAEPIGVTGANHQPSVDDLVGPAREPVRATIGAEPAVPDRRRSTALPSVAPDPEPGAGRSRFNADAGVVLYNERHADYLLVKDDESGLLDYLSTLVAKEYVLYNNPRSRPEEFSEELVRMLVRVRRHLPRRR